MSTENDGKGAVVTRSDGGGLKDLGDMCETVEMQAREAKFAAVAGEARDFEAAIERAQDEISRLRLAYRRWLAIGQPVSDNRAST